MKIKNNKFKKIIQARFLLAFLCIFLTGILALLAGCNVFTSTATTKKIIQKGIETEIEIKDGMTLTAIAALLEENGIIDNGLYFKVYAEEKGFEKKMMPGKYTLKTGSEYDEVLKIITSGPVVVTVKLAIPEGFMLKQISERITVELPFIVKADLDKALDPSNYNYDFLSYGNIRVENLEGFLFPKTYEVLPQYSAQNVIEMFLSQYQLETSSLDYKFAADNNFTAYDILKIASMIEKEAYLPEERPLISSVIYNRLKINMSLGIDATLTYFLDKWDSPLTESDLKTDTLFNTRLHTGLPPTPICNPGLESIKAAINPAQTDYLYYVVTDAENHKHSFSKSNAGQIKNIKSTTTVK